MDIKPVYLFLIAFIVITIGIVVLQESSDNVEAMEYSIVSDTQNFTSTSTTSILSPVGEGITSSSFQIYNQTWLNFDGVNDYVLSNRYDTISFWYKNSTSNWIFVVNSSGTTYVNGVAGTPVQYPVYDNGTNMFIGKTDATTFFNGSIDDFRGYNSSIDSDLVELIYNGGRL